MRAPIRRPNLRRLRAELDSTAVRTWDIAHLKGGPGGIVFAGAPAELPAGMRVYAIGDIHGQLDRLRALHAAIAADLNARPVAAPLLVHLGDFIDWGPDSAGVVALLAGGPPVAGVPVVNLSGDHEQMLLDALDGDGPAATDWLHSGGGAALASWGIDPATPRADWAGRLPPAHLAFLRGLALRHRVGGYVFVHAGLRPGIRISEQSRQDLHYIREPFLSTDRGFGVVVVHGHTVAATPVVRANRVGLDTGAGLGGKLSCAVLEDDRIGFISI
jgi:serine/threonine protein phosphatase 1